MKKKKTIRNILIAAAVVVVIVAAVVLSIALRKDGRGMNAFERGRIAASADGVTVTMQEYAMTFDSLVQSYSYSTLSDEQIRNLQDNAANQALLTKIYTKEAKALGLSLTDEEIKACKDSAQEQLDGVVEAYTEQLVEGGNFSKAALDKQVANYYAMIGMTQTQYYRYCQERSEANYYMNKLEDYYKTNGSGFSEDEVLAYYHDSVKESMDSYSAGQYSSSLMMYAYGYSMPMLFVPEDFFYIDCIQVSKKTEEEVNEVFNKVINGGKEDESVFVLQTKEEEDSSNDKHLPSLDPLSFDELSASEDNVNPYRSIVDGPYAIGDNDYGYLFSTYTEVYEAAKALEIGQIGTYIVPVSQTDTDGNELISGYIGYMFRRAEGTMCEEGDSGIIKIDWYPTVRESVESGMRQKNWMKDAAYTDAVYTYRGSLA